MTGVLFAVNLRLLAHHDAGGAPNLGEGMAIKLGPGGRRYLYVAHEHPPVAFTIFQNTVVATWFSAGLRIYDIADPYRLEEIAAFLPETPEGQRGCRISDVFVEDRGIIHAADRARGGLYVLEYTGKHPLD